MQTKKIVCSECNIVNSIKLVEETSPILCTTCEADLDHPFSIEATDESCTTHIDENEIGVLVDFYSTTCGPCMSMYEAYEDAALGFGATVRFIKINADIHQKVAAKYGVRALPTIIAFKNATEVERINSALSQVQLSLWAEKLV
jgi:thioredoxin 2